MKRMKLKSLYTIFVIAFAVACNETLDQIGLTVQPDDDRLKIEIDTLGLQARTIQTDSVFSKIQYPVLGEYTDPIFGSIKSEYIGEFYFPEGGGFLDNVAGIDSVRVQLAYTTIMGDSLSPMGLSVYRVNKSLKGISNYSDVDPSNYADMSAPLGAQVFTGKNSTYRMETSGSSTIKVYEINVMLPNAIGESFLAEYQKENHGKLVNVDTFREFFPGLYFTTTFGKSTILNVSLTSLLVHYRYNDIKGSSTGQDTIRPSALRLNITPEVTQINHISNKNDQLLPPSNEYTYVKSPAGVMTEITFPFSVINNKLKAQALNLANLTMYALPEPHEETLVKLAPPSHLLLINKDSLNGFFEKKRLTDNVTSFLSSGFNSSTYSYQFGNISTMANHYNQINEGKPFDLVYYLVPVDATFATDQYGNQTTTPISISNRLWPSAVKLDKREKSLKLDLIFSNF
jgi:hypothetical protein